MSPILFNNNNNNNNKNNNNNNNNNNNLTDIPLGKQLPRESLTPAKVFENVSY